ncbi:MAG: FecR family protein [Saonia sp.]
MNNSEIHSIISKFLDNEATVDEKAFLIEWIKDENNRAYFEDFVKTDIWIKYNFDSSMVEKQLSTLAIGTKPKKIKFRKDFLKYAAIFILILSTFLTFYFQTGPSHIQVLDENIISLEINDGSTNYISLEDHQNFHLGDNTIKLKKKGLLEYFPTDRFDQESHSSEHHTIHVPYGKTFAVRFADGSRVHLNSGSRLSYPKNFGGFDSREVSLVGEAYFKIAKSDKPFQVNTEHLSAKVLGTEFNVSAYKDGVDKEIILVEGSVKVLQNTAEDDAISKVLIPNQRATKSNGNPELIIEHVDVKNHIAWRDGILVFNNENIEEIIKKLERRFNVDIQNNYEKLNEFSFTGRFKEENVDAILKTMQAHTNFSYSMIGNVLNIDQPN